VHKPKCTKFKTFVQTGNSRPFTLKELIFTALMKDWWKLIVHIQISQGSVVGLTHLR